MSTEFLEAALVEQSTINVEEMMEALMNGAQEEGLIKERPDDMKLRDYLFVINSLEKEIEKYKINKKTVVQRWDEMIDKKQENVDQLRSIILLEMKLRKEESPKNGKLILDIGTISTTVKKPAVISPNDMMLEMKARETGDFAKFIVPAKLDKTALLKHLNEEYKEKKIIPEGYEGIVTLSEETESLAIRSKLKK